jgi:hypothetical protein
MNFQRTALPAALLAITAAFAPAAAAQTTPLAPATAPPAWTVSSDETRGTVEIAATAKGGAVRFVGGCDKDAAPGILGAFSQYAGGGLRTDGQVESVAFYARGEDWQDAFAVQLRYVPARGAWIFAKPLSPVFLASFSRGATLAVVNNRNQEVFTFDLTGSTAATRALRTVCGLK